MNKLRKLFFIISTFIIVYFIGANGVKAADWTCNYITQDSTMVFSFNIKNNKLSSRITKSTATDTNIALPKWVMEAVDKLPIAIPIDYMYTDKIDLSIKDFVTAEGKAGCPKIYYSVAKNESGGWQIKGGNSFHYSFSTKSSVPALESWKCTDTKSGAGSVMGGAFFNDLGQGVVDFIVGKTTCATDVLAVSLPHDNIGIDTGMIGNLPSSTAPAPEPMPEGSCGFIGPQTLEIIEWIIKIIRIVIPILVIFLGIVDFASAMFSGEDKSLKQSGTRFVTRLIAAIILIFLPYLLSFLINISGIAGDYNITPDNMFCAFF